MKGEGFYACYEGQANSPVENNSDIEHTQLIHSFQPIACFFLLGGSTGRALNARSKPPQDFYIVFSG